MAEETKTTPPDFFQAIGQKVDSSSDEDHKLVEEIESLCMNCHKNVGILPSRLRGAIRPTH